MRFASCISNAFVIRMSPVKHPANGTEIVVEDLGIDGPEISELCFGRECEIGIITRNGWWIRGILRRRPLLRESG